MRCTQTEGGSEMVTKDSVEKQLKKLHFNPHGWGRTEARELPNILLPDEEIYEVVNGFYDGGFALLVATNVRLLLIDKKPMNYLTVEDMRFDMINELDYSHRLLGARINVSAGSKNLIFTSLNQARLRKAINHVQHCMAEAKQKVNEHAEDQKAHLEQINQQLQAYLLAQHQHQQQLEKRAEAAETKEQANANTGQSDIKPSPELADYLYAQSIRAQYEALSGQKLPEAAAPQVDLPPEVQAQMPAYTPPPIPNATNDNNSQMTELYEEGMKEIFGNQQPPQPVSPPAQTQAQPSDNGGGHKLPHLPNPLEVNALKIAYSKLPMALRNRKFGSPSFHAHSQADPADISQIQSNQTSAAHAR
jgi:hypothetical protein